MRREERALAEHTIRTAVHALGYEVLGLTISNGRVLCLTIDLDPGPVTIQHCTALNWKVRDALTGAGIDPDGWQIEVESPGPHRPLLRLRHFERCAGSQAKVKLRRPRPDGQTVLIGTIEGVKDGSILLRTGKGDPIAVSENEIAEAHLSD